MRGASEASCLSRRPWPTSQSQKHASLRSRPLIRPPPSRGQALRAPSPASRRRAGSLSRGWTSPAAPPSPRPIANPARRLHHVAMPTLVILMIVGAIVAALWSSARAAAERAAVLGRHACRAANVQLLVQHVTATGVRLHRGAAGRRGFARRFCFEYSVDRKSVVEGQRVAVRVDFCGCWY